MIGLVGLNHKTAPVEIREKFVFDEKDIVNFIYRAKEENESTELVVLSTCNRTEVYFNLTKDCDFRNFSYILKKLGEFKKIKKEINPYFYTLGGREAVEHLFKVAAGLDSMVLGENQVLGQVKEAYRISASRKYTGSVLNKLFHRAFEVGKKVRTDTEINKGASSVSYAAVELASKIFSDLKMHPVLLNGAGETGELALKSLVERGSNKLFITNRTFSRAEKLAKNFGALPVRFEELKDKLTECDIVITSTSSPEPLFSFKMLKEAMKMRRHRTIFLIDLSVPRDIDEKVKRLENVFLYDIDDLEEVVAHNYEKRKHEIKKAEKIINKIMDEFFSWVSTLSLAPTIDSLCDKLETMTISGLKNLKSSVTETEFSRMSEFGELIKKKYIGLIVKNLKELSKNGQKPEYINLVNNLFGLSAKKIEE
jgi:glutamyl-tRNA reductase